MKTASEKYRVLLYLVYVGWLAVTSIFIAGCGDAAPAGNEAQTMAAMRLLGMQYAQYLAAHNNSAPKDEAAMRSWLEAHMNELTPYGVKSVDDLLKSSRDGQPLIVIYGKKVVDPDHPDMAWAAYEQTGAGGASPGLQYSPRRRQARSGGIQ